MCSLTHQVDALHILTEVLDSTCSKGNVEDRHSVCGDASKKSSQIKTIAERARENCLSRLLDILTRLISIEQDVLNGVSYGESLLRRKDSVDLKNICLRMALGEDGPRKQRDLKELRDCLRLIVGGLLACIRGENSQSFTVTTHRLNELSNSFPEI